MVTFLAWSRNERTLSIHAITSMRREAFYWAAILFTFALGTAAGDLVSEQMALGYALSGLIFGAMIALITLGHYAFRLNAIFAFWSAYVLARPLGASIGDFLTQAHKDGGLDLSTTSVSVTFFVIIVALVAYLTVSGIDQEGLGSGCMAGDRQAGSFTGIAVSQDSHIIFESQARPPHGMTRRRGETQRTDPICCFRRERLRHPPVSETPAIEISDHAQRVAGSIRRSTRSLRK